MQYSFNSKDKIINFYIEHFPLLTKNWFLVSQNEIKKIPGWYSWYQAILKGRYWYEWIQDFCYRNWIKRSYNVFDPYNAETYINEHIISSNCLTWKKLIKETELKKRFKVFYKYLIEWKIPWYNSYFDLALKKWLDIHIDISRLNEEKYFQEVCEKFILPLAKNNKLLINTLKEHNYQMFYRSLNEWVVKWISSFSDFKKKYWLK